MIQSAYLRPGFTPVTIALMVAGFVVFWPLGLVMLAYMLWGDRMRGWRPENKSFRHFCGGRHGRYRAYERATGNLAFDDWRRDELNRIEEERRKLDAMRAEFEDYMMELRRARDREEFDRFMRQRKDRGQDTPVTEA